MADRRDFLKKGALLGMAGLAHSLIGKENIDQIANTISLPGGNFTLPALPYAYDALEPFIDKQTMEIHHTKHHQGYIDKLNTAPIKEVGENMDDVSRCKKINDSTPALIRNNLGGYYNHSLFWQLLKPNPSAKSNGPTGALMEAIDKNFKNFDNFKKEFSEKAGKIFGSGWCWLVVNTDNNLKIVTTPNQDNPLMPVAPEQGKPVLALDVWEHAYYLKYQNKRADYITGWWNVVNWEKAGELYSSK